MKTLYFSKNWVLPVVCFVITAYFIYHSIEGNRGWKKMQQINSEIEIATIVARQTNIQRELLTQKVKSLSGESLDLDQLEESALRVLNMGDPKNRIILAD